MMKNIILLILFGLLTTSGWTQQESQYTLFMYNKQYFNPAYAGVRGLASVQLMYRKQWFGFEGAPESKLLSFNAPLSKDKKTAIGVLVSNTEIGFIRKWNGTMAYSYDIKFNDEASVRIGVQGSMKYYGINFSDSRFYTVEGNDPSVLDNTDAEVYKFNVGVGFYFMYNNFFFGGSSPSILNNSIGFNNSPSTKTAEEATHFYLMTGLLWPLSSTVKLQPSLLGKYVKNAPFDLEANLSLIYDNRITTGISYRAGGTGAGESVDLLLMYQAKQLGLGLAYDFPIGELSQHTVGSLEALVRFDFGKEALNMANPRFFY